MTNSLKQYIKKKLKENIPVKEIIQELKEKGYSAYEIKNSLKEVAADIERPPKKMFPIIFVGILIVAISIAVFYQFSTTKEKSSESRVSKEKDDKTLIQKFIQENLREEYYPTSLDIKHLSELPDIFALNGTTWTGKLKDKNISLSAVIQYNFISRFKNLVVSVGLPDLIDLDNVTARSFHQEFFKTTGTDWTCKDENNYTICGSFSENKSDTVLSPIGNSTLIYSNRIYPY